MADKAILATLPKLNGSNWFEWKKEVETFLLLVGLDGIIDAEDVPTRAKEFKGSQNICISILLY